MIQFAEQVDSMCPYYGLVDLNDSEVSEADINALADIIMNAEGSIACEIKEDGYRFQAHVNNDKMFFFTRGRDAGKTTRFEARTLPEIVEALTALRLKETILDGEIKGVKGGFEGYKAIQSRARYEGRILDKGIEKYLSKDKLPEKYPLELVIFDVMMYNGIPCINLQYAERREIIKEIAGKSKITRPAAQKLILTPEKLISFYRKKVQGEQREGLVLKQPTLEYIPGDKTHWIKLKKFETLDLVIVGLCKSEDAKGFGQAMVAAYNPETRQYQTVGTINLLRKNNATGNLFAKDIQEQLADRLTENPAQCVVIGEKTAAVYVHPKQSLLLEIRAMNIERTNSESFACSPDDKNFYSLRTGYVKSIREDKLAPQATTCEQIAQLYSMQR